MIIEQVTEQMFDLAPGWGRKAAFVLFTGRFLFFWEDALTLIAQLGYVNGRVHVSCFAFATELVFQGEVCRASRFHLRTFALDRGWYVGQATFLIGGRPAREAGRDAPCR